MNEILKVFNQYKKRIFAKIQQEVENSLWNSYNLERENWDALHEWEREQWSEKNGGYGGWWYEYIDSPYDGIYEYINELMDRYWNSNEVFIETLNANAGLDPKTIYDELVNLVYGIMDKIVDIKATKSKTTIYLNWNENPFEV